MRRAYAQMDSAGWVQKQYKREMSSLGREVAQILGVVGGGIYNAPINIDRVNWYDSSWGVHVYWRGTLANWDSPALALLLIECHHRMIRVEIEPGNMQGLRLVFHKRESRDGGMAERLPTLATIEAMVDAWYAPKSKGEKGKVL